MMRGNGAGEGLEAREWCKKLPQNRAKMRVFGAPLACQ